MKKKKIIIIASITLVSALALALIIPFTILGIRTALLKADYSYLKNNQTYKDKVEVTGVNLVEQHVSCGYASIEMISDYFGKKVTEDELDSRNNGQIATSTSKGFLDEINKSIESKDFMMHSYLKDDIFLKEIYIALYDQCPVAVEWAAKYENEWTLHFSVVTGFDLQNNNVTIYNPYGYIENIKIEEFLDRTSFNSYSNMPLFLNFGFAFGAFHKNTIFFAK